MSREVKLIEISNNAAGDITIKIPRSYLRHTLAVHDDLPEGSRVTNTKVFSDAVVRPLPAAPSTLTAGDRHDD